MEPLLCFDDFFGVILWWGKPRRTIPTNHRVCEAGPSLLLVSSSSSFHHSFVVPLLPPVSPGRNRQIGGGGSPSPLQSTPPPFFRLQSTICLPSLRASLGSLFPSLLVCGADLEEEEEASASAWSPSSAAKQEVEWSSPARCSIGAAAKQTAADKG